MVKRHIARHLKEAKEPESRGKKKRLLMIPAFHAFITFKNPVAFKMSLNHVCSGTDIQVCKKPSGFTLIEVLISLTLLTIVLGAVYSSFFSVQNVLDRFDKVSLKYHEARTALDIMRREIEGANLKISRINNAENSKSSFVIKDRDILGKSTSSLELTSFSFKGSGLSEISYYVEEKDGILSLLKKEAPAGISSSAYTIETMEGIEGFIVETLFNNQWVRTWDTTSTRRLPEILRVSIAFDDNGKTIKLTEYARPKLGKQL